MSKKQTKNTNKKNINRSKNKNVTNSNLNPKKNIETRVIKAKEKKSEAKVEVGTNILPANEERKNIVEEVAAQENPKQENNITEETVIEYKEVKEEQKEIIDNKQEDKKVEEIKKETIKSVKQVEEMIHSVSLPKVNIVDLLFKPSLVIESLHFDSSSTFMNIVSLFVKHGLSVISLVVFLTNILNKSAFSFVRLTFSQSSWLWFRVAFFLFIADIVSTIVSSCMIEKKFNMKKVNELFFYEQKTALYSIILVNLIGIILNTNLFIGVLCLVFTLVYLLNMKSLVIEKVFKTKKDTTMWYMQLFYLVFTLILLFSRVNYFGDIVMIFEALF